MLLHNTLVADARTRGPGVGFDFGPLLASVTPRVRAADLAICHLETPVAPPAGPFRTYPAFSVPPQIVPALDRAGFDACSTASNHSLDAGRAGITRTLDALDRAGIAHAGTARSAAEARAVSMLRVDGVRIALLSYTYGFNAISYPDGDAWLANRINPAAMLQAAHRARQQGAQIVVLKVHWGTEFSHVPSGEQRALARRLLGSPDVDVLIGEHAHVVQPLERIGAKWVAYGLGNMVADQSRLGPDKAEGLAVQFTFARTTAGRWRVSRAEYAPLLMTPRAPFRVYDVSAVLAGRRAVGVSETRLRQAWTRTVRHVDALGARTAGAVAVRG